MIRRAILACGLALACTTAGGTGAVAEESAGPVPVALGVEQRLFLIGDAGVPQPDDPVLAALESDVAEAPRSSLVVYLGDNAYPRGLPPPEAKERARAERYLDEQIAVARAGARAIFVPGNHDWDKHSPEGWDAVRRQARYVERAGGGATSLLPTDGCPGPLVQDVGTRLRLVLLDTQWWLHRGPKPLSPGSPCPEGSEPEVLEALARALDEAGERHVVVAGHHPLASGGPHGGHFSWRDHLFPLRALDSRLWLPLPGIGSLYPLARRGGVSRQDLSNDVYRRMREGLAGVFARHPPLVYAAGHEHNLQVIRGPSGAWLLVSGGGSFAHVSPVSRTRETVYAAASSGYMRLDLSAKGGARLTVVAVDRSGPAEALALELGEAPTDR